VQSSFSRKHSNVMSPRPLHHNTEETLPEFPFDPNT
jgi:hypothetical protein